jgi:hypothetical protein
MLTRTLFEQSYIKSDNKSDNEMGQLLSVEVIIRYYQIYKLKLYTNM